jgi:hypothetical protein
VVLAPSGLWVPSLLSSLPYPLSLFAQPATTTALRLQHLWLIVSGCAGIKLNIPGLGERIVVPYFLVAWYGLTLVASWGPDLCGRCTVLYM